MSALLPLLVLAQTKALSFGPIVIFDDITVPEGSLISIEVMRELKLNRDVIQNRRDALHEKTHKQSFNKRVAAIKGMLADIYRKMTPDQKNRYVQLLRQEYGPTLLLSKTVPQPFKLSTEQSQSFRSKVVHLSAQYQSEALQLRKKPGAVSALATLSQRYEGQFDVALLQLLTPEQAQKWQASLGKPAAKPTRRPSLLSLVSPR